MCMHFRSYLDTLVHHRCVGSATATTHLALYRVCIILQHTIISYDDCDNNITLSEVDVKYHHTQWTIPIIQILYYKCMCGQYLTKDTHTS
jgi:hypothetical protein